MSKPEFHSAYAEQEYAVHPEYSQIVGVFRDTSQAIAAIEELKRAHFAEEKIKLTEYDPHLSAEEESALLQGADRRFFVHVDAPGKEEEAVGILAHHGANNSDLPRGTELVHGRLTFSHTPMVGDQPSSDTVTAAPGLERGLTDHMANDPRVP